MSLYYQNDYVTLYHGDAADTLRTLPSDSVDCIITSPPYFGLRNYGAENEIGNGQTLPEYVKSLVKVFNEARRVLKTSGTLWLNLGDSYARGFGGGTPGTKSKTNIGSHDNRSAGKKAIPGSGKNLVGVPWRVALAMQDDGWTLRSEIVWRKSNAMPESVKDRPTKTHEHIFMFVKNDKYFYNHFESKSDTGAKLRTVWDIPNKPFKGAHFATFPTELPARCMTLGCPPGGVVLDMFNGSGTTGEAALLSERKYVGVDSNSDYLRMSADRLTSSYDQQVIDLEALA